MRHRWSDKRTKTSTLGLKRAMRSWGPIELPAGIAAEIIETRRRFHAEQEATCHDESVAALGSPVARALDISHTFTPRWVEGQRRRWLQL